MANRDELWVDPGGKVTVRLVNEDGVPVEIPAEEQAEFERKIKESRGIGAERKPGPAETKQLEEAAARAPKPFVPEPGKSPFGGKGDHDKDGKTGGTAAERTAERPTERKTLTTTTKPAA